MGSPDRYPAPAKAKAASPAKAAAKAAHGKPQAQTPADPLKPRLRPAGAPLDRQALEREAKKKKARVSELEQRIAAAEQQVKAIETRMAEPGFYEDREQAEHGSRSARP